MKLFPSRFSDIILWLFRSLTQELLVSMEINMNAFACPYEGRSISTNCLRYQCQRTQKTLISRILIDKQYNVSYRIYETLDWWKNKRSRRKWYFICVFLSIFHANNDERLLLKSEKVKFLTLWKEIYTGGAINLIGNWFRLNGKLPISGLMAKVTKTCPEIEVLSSGYTKKEKVGFF